MRQLKFVGIPKVESQFGGSGLIGKRKGRRPLSTTSPNHVIIKSEKIDKQIAFVRYKGEIFDLITTNAKRFGIKLHSRSINFNHIHLIMSFRSRGQYVSFVRVLNAAIVSFLEKKSDQVLRGIFALRPFTRIVKWGRDFFNLLRYVQINQFESRGLDFRRRWTVAEGADARCSS